VVQRQQRHFSKEDDKRGVEDATTPTPTPSMCMQDAATPTPTRPLDTRVRTGRTPHASSTCTQDVAGRVTLDAVHAGRLMHPRRARLDMNAVRTSSMASTHTHTTCPSRCARLPHTFDAMRTPSTRARSCQTPRADPRRALSTRTLNDTHPQ
jgi:hypothetical protein